MIVQPRAGVTVFQFREATRSDARLELAAPRDVSLSGLRFAEPALHAVRNSAQYLRLIYLPIELVSISGEPAHCCQLKERNY